jgi:hypothetical protein
MISFVMGLSTLLASDQQQYPGHILRLLTLRITLTHTFGDGISGRTSLVIASAQSIRTLHTPNHSPLRLRATSLFYMCIPLQKGNKEI